MTSDPPVRVPSRELIERQATELQGVPLRPERAEELAREVRRLNDVTAEAADRHLGFFDEPAAFLVALAEMADRDA